MCVYYKNECIAGLPGPTMSYSCFFNTTSTNKLKAIFDHLAEHAVVVLFASFCVGVCSTVYLSVNRWKCNCAEAPAPEPAGKIRGRTVPQGIYVCRIYSSFVNIIVSPVLKSRDLCTPTTPRTHYRHPTYVP